MELSIMERLLILNLDTLPKVGSILTMKIKQQLINDVSFNEDEIKDYNIRQEDGNVKWNQNAPSKEVEIGEQASKLLIEALDNSKNLNELYIPLYDKMKEADA